MDWVSTTPGQDQTQLVIHATAWRYCMICSLHISSNVSEWLLLAYMRFLIVFFQILQDEASEWLHTRVPIMGWQTSSASLCIASRVLFYPSRWCHPPPWPPRHSAAWATLATPPCLQPPPWWLSVAGRLLAQQTMTMVSAVQLVHIYFITQSIERVKS